MWLMTLLLVALMGRAVAKKPDGFYDYFHYQLTHLLNSSVSPCDNFYRHVCRVDLSENDTADYYNNNLIEALVNEVLIDADSYGVYGKSKVEQVAPSKPGRFLEQLRKTEAFIKYVENNNLISKVTKLNRVANEIINVLRSEMAVTKIEPKLATQFERTLETLEVFIGFSSLQYEKRRFELVQKAVDQEYANYFVSRNQTPVIKTDYEHRKSDFDAAVNSLQTFETLKYFEPKLFMLIDEFGEQNSKISDSAILIYMSHILAVLKGTDAAYYGYFGYLFGHELVHRFLGENQPWKDNKAMFDQGMCTMNHMARIREAFSKQRTEFKSPFQTFDEDVADFEGSKLAYKAFLARFKAVLNDKAYPDLEVTNQQMFFYSLGIRRCSHTDNIYGQHSNGEERVNGIVSLADSFHTAFHCNASSPMRMVAKAPRNCVFFGSGI